MHSHDLWKAVEARDPSADGRFVYGVVTTGVYCRPSCPARRPLRENVEFFASGEEARRAGLRPCRRCDPDGPGALARRVALVVEACRILDAAVEAPDLAHLAAAVGSSPSHLHRSFKTVTGLTPKAYAVARRADRAGRELRADGSVTAAIYRAGFGSAGRFYESSTARLGMTPSALRAGGPGVTVRFAVLDSTLGLVLVAATAQGVCAIEFGEDADELVRGLAARFPAAHLDGSDEQFRILAASVVGLVEDPTKPCDLPLDIRGTAFQERVWRALRGIPAGTRLSYSEVASRIGAPGAARAVGRACAANHVAVAIPCHRVVGADGALTGYRWGPARKRALLAREQNG